MEPPDDDQIQHAVRETKELIKILESTNIRRVRIEAGSFKIEIERAFSKGGAAAPMAAPAAAPGGNAGSNKLHKVLAPLVGTFYLSSGPGAKPFVEVGTRVNPGQTIGIIEVMKVMNSVTSDVAGVVVEISVQNGHPVQYEQPLMVIDTSAA